MGDGRAPKKRAAEVVGTSPARRKGTLVAALAALATVAVVVAIAARVADRPSAEPAATPLPSSVPSEPLALGLRNGVNTDRDHDRFIYALEVRNASDVDVTIDSVELVPEGGARVVLATLIDPAEFERVSDPSFVPSDSREARRMRPRSAAVLFLRVEVDCARPPVVTAMRVRMVAGAVPVVQDIAASSANPGGSGLDLSGLPARTCA